MKTSINGEPAPWTAAMRRLFRDRVPPVKHGRVTSANYWTGRPGGIVIRHATSGFVYTINHRRVCFVEW